jgi:H-type small acid-soluble spore protein
MNITRANEILNSSDNIEVLYKDSPIWIENINKEKGTVNVKMLSTNQQLEVNPEYLVETGKISR